MKITRNGDGTIVNVGNKVRIEQSPKRRREIATEELLASFPPGTSYQVGLPDSLGRIIELGVPMDFIDRGSSGVDFVVYVLTTVDEEVNGEPVAVDRFLPESRHASEELALSRAFDLAAEAA